MNFNFFEFVLDNLEASGAIAGYVSISIIGFAVISFFAKQRNGNLLDQIGPKGLHPVIGSFLGAIPGCGATIVIASLYKNKKISFGGLLAAFISTLGEGSFVLLGASSEADVSGNLKAYAIITFFGIISGIIFGYLFDTIGFKFNTDIINNDNKQTKNNFSQKSSFLDFFIKKIGFKSIILMSLFLAPGSIMALWGGSIESIENLTFWVSIILTITCIIFYLINKLSDQNHDCISDYNDIKSTLLHAVTDIAMVVTFVFVGLFIANFIIDILVGAENFDSWMTSSSYLLVLIAALVGLTPGCGGMISVAVAFIVIPNFPISALIAASIATSGDGIFPLLADNRKDGLLVSMVGLVIALIVGYFSLFLGF
tara:strand:- start:9436 stop:10542 length:1107 start_codon:yes stop_codon:yes gene_type:complete